jgi:hypothetical protein
VFNKTSYNHILQAYRLREGSNKTFFLVPVPTVFKPLNLGLLVDCSTSYGQVLTELPTILFYKHIGHGGRGVTKLFFFFLHFFLVPAVDGFKPLNIGLLVDCITNCTATSAQVLTELLTITFYKHIG